MTTPFAFNPSAVSCEPNPGSTVTPEYSSPFRFTGGRHSVTVDISAELTADSESELRMAMARQ